MLQTTEGVQPTRLEVVGPINEVNKFQTIHIWHLPSQCAKEVASYEASRIPSAVSALELYVPAWEPHSNTVYSLAYHAVVRHNKG